MPSTTTREEEEDDDDDNEIAGTPPPQRVTRSKMRPPPKQVVVATAPALPGRLTRSKMARKPAQPTSVPASVTTDDSKTPTPSTDGYTEPETPATVINVKGSVCLPATKQHLLLLVSFTQLIFCAC